MKGIIEVLHILGGNSMVEMNELMKNILKHNQEGKSLFIKDNIVAGIVKNTKMINNCIIYDKDGLLDNEEVDFDRLLKITGDWTGYEVGCNELRLERKDISDSQIEMLAKNLYNNLSQKFNGSKLVVYVLLFEDDVEIRFHSYREQEGLWLTDNLNEYEYPILYCM